MGHDDRHIGEIYRDIIKVHGIRVFEAHTAAAAHTGTDTRMPGMKNSWQTGLSDNFIEDIRAAVIWIEFLHGRMKFESSHPEMLDETAGLARSHLSLRGIDACKGYQHVGVLSSDFGNLLIRYSYQASCSLHIYGENNAGHFTLAIVNRDLSDGRSVCLVLKIVRRCLLHCLPQW